jgi:hypothetical protein
VYSPSLIILKPPYTTPIGSRIHRQIHPTVTRAVPDIVLRHEALRDASFRQPANSRPREITPSKVVREYNLEIIVVTCSGIPPLYDFR